MICYTRLRSLTVIQGLKLIHDALTDEDAEEHDGDHLAGLAQNLRAAVQHLQHVNLGQRRGEQEGVRVWGSRYSQARPY